MDFKLRPWVIDDLDDLVKNANNINVAKFLNDVFPHPYTAEHGQEFIEMLTSGEIGDIYAIEVEGKAVGSIGLHPQRDVHRKNVEIGYWLAEDCWDNGIVTRAVREVVEIAFRDPDIDRVFARPFGTNKASHRVLEKAGFKLEARFEKTIFKNGEYLDELVYAIRK